MKATPKSGRRGSDALPEMTKAERRPPGRWQRLGLKRDPRIVWQSGDPLPTVDVKARM